MSFSQRNCVLGNDRFSCRCVRCDEHRVPLLQVIDSLLLERVELERVLESIEMK